MRLRGAPLWGAGEEVVGKGRGIVQGRKEWEEIAWWVHAESVGLTQTLKTVVKLMLKGSGVLRIEEGVAGRGGRCSKVLWTGGGVERRGEAER